MALKIILELFETQKAAHGKVTGLKNLADLVYTLTDCTITPPGVRNWVANGILPPPIKPAVAGKSGAVWSKPEVLTYLREWVRKCDLYEELKKNCRQKIGAPTLKSVLLIARMGGAV